MLEGRLMAMLKGLELTLESLNEMTQAWLSQDYHRSCHRELGVPPMRRYLDAPHVGRDCPDSEALRRAFRMTVERRQRRSDGTFTLAGKRFEVPGQYRHLETLQVRYARWDLCSLELVDPHTHTELCRVYPLDKQANADGKRRALDSDEDLSTAKSGTMPPLLRQYLADYHATGLPPAYLPKPEGSHE
jgi:hypothetical protein